MQKIAQSKGQDLIQVIMGFSPYLGQVMNRRDRDFVALYNDLWYKDFPVTRSRQDINRRALWTTHIASTVKQSADLLGLFTCSSATAEVMRRATQTARSPLRIFIFELMTLKTHCGSVRWAVLGTMIRSRCLPD